MEKNYCIMTSCDDNLIPYVAVGLTAMAHNLKDAAIEFFLFHSRVSRENLDMLGALCKELENGRIRFHEIFVPQAEIYNQLARYGGGWIGEAYYSLCAHLLLPDTIDRILYLDAGDTLVLGDIAPYYEGDFHGKSLTVTGVGTMFIRSNGEPVALTIEDMSDRERLRITLRGLFNSGAYMINLDKMREDERTLADYQYLSEVIRELLGEDETRLYWGDQGFLSMAFVGDIQYYGFPEILDPYDMPYNFCLWYYDAISHKPDYSPKILHFAGTAFKPWEAKYPVYLERFQGKRQLHALGELREGQAEYFNLWKEYAVMTDQYLTRIGF